MKPVVDIAMFMLYIVVAGLVIANADGFATALNAIGTNWVRTLRVLQTPGAAR